MKIRPILFSAPMVLAILEGRKTQTRRAIKRLPWYDPAQNRWIYRGLQFNTEREAFSALKFLNPYGQPGGRLWVRETWCPIYAQDPAYNNGEPIEIDYKAGHSKDSMQWRLMDDIGTRRWKPSIHMPRRASRILLEITGVRVERLNEISSADAMSEGCEKDIADGESLYWFDGLGIDKESGRRFAYDEQEAFSWLWESINGPGSWAANPWVWVIDFQRV